MKLYQEALLKGKALLLNGPQGSYQFKLVMQIPYACQETETTYLMQPDYVRVPDNLHYGNFSPDLRTSPWKHNLYHYMNLRKKKAPHTMQILENSVQVTIFRAVYNLKLLYLQPNNHYKSEHAGPTKCARIYLFPTQCPGLGQFKILKHGLNLLLSPIECIHDISFSKNMVKFNKN